LPDVEGTQKPPRGQGRSLNTILQHGDAEFPFAKALKKFSQPSPSSHPATKRCTAEAHPHLTILPVPNPLLGPQRRVCVEAAHIFPVESRVFADICGLWRPERRRIGTFVRSDASSCGLKPQSRKRGRASRVWQQGKCQRASSFEGQPSPA